MASSSSLALIAVFLVSAACAAPQLGSGYPLQPQLIRQGGYLQPQLSRGYYQPESYVQPQRRIAIQYNQPIQRYSYSPAPQIQYSHVTPEFQYGPQQLYRQQSGGRSAAILRQAQDAGLDGAFSYGFDSEDGISVQTSAGPLTAVGPEEAVQTVTGSYSYTAPDGTPITTNWIADENGFRAEGAHLPKAPETQFRSA